jgi:hypothetical protein
MPPRQYTKILITKQSRDVLTATAAVGVTVVVGAGRKHEQALESLEAGYCVRKLGTATSVRLASSGGTVTVWVMVAVATGECVMVV